jgi:hypothetical protein
MPISVFFLFLKEKKKVKSDIDHLGHFLPIFCSIALKIVTANNG